MKEYKTRGLLQLFLLIFAFVGCNNYQNKQTEINNHQDSIAYSDEVKVIEMWIDSTYRNVENLNINEGKFELKEKDGWIDFEKENIGRATISKTEDITFKELKFKVVWDNKLSFSDNIGYYDGIKQLKIYLNNQLVNVFDSISDEVALGEIHITFYDYNFDGFIDFTLPLDCKRLCTYNYYIYNPVRKKFEIQEDWSVLSIQKINKRTKEILTQPDLRDGRILYKVEGCILKKIAKESNYN